MKKFRGKSYCDDKWVFGDLQHNYGDTWISKLECGDEYGFFINVNPTTVCQFTGKKHNNLLIFEKDIISNSKHTNGLVLYDDNKAMYVVRFNEITNDIPLYLCCDDTLVVIGNIIDNPELCPFI